ncbi:T9SS type A sorting domain-containing protein [Hyphobacterium sp. CCMP332]|nr:T9SS type A sorting domain-containing protein [Hyphobacterium sp. CCMP332]
MKRIYLLLIATLLFSFGSYAQLTRTNPELFKTALPAVEKAKTGQESINIPKNSYLKQPTSIPSYGDTVGFTWYDLQTNAGVSRRIHQDDNGNIQVVWTKGLDTITDPTLALRGIGYNYYDAGTQTWNPGDSLNTPYGIADLRMGWPSVAPIKASNEAIFAHPRRLFTNPVKGQTNYTAFDLTAPLHGVNNEPFQWYNVSAEGNSLYAVAQVANASCEFGRSDDGGQTWVINSLFPDSAAGAPLRGTGADGYDIDTKGDTVVIVTGGYTGYSGTDPNDLVMLMSTDRGATWTSTAVHVFDTINAAFDSASGGYQVLTPHPDARVTIGADGRIHITGSLMAALTNPGDLTSNSWFPLTRGIWYWNSDMPAGFDLNDSVDYANYILTDSIPDLTTMGTYPSAFADQPSYVAGSMTHPSVCENVNNGNLYIVFDAVTCGSNNNPFDNLYRRDLFTMVSGNGGASWSDAKNIASLLFANDITDGTVGEEAFPSMTKQSSDGFLHILFQHDSWGGTSLVDATVLEKNFMTYLKLDQSIIDNAVALNDVGLDENTIKLYPNPASGFSNLQFESQLNGESQLVLSNLMGQIVKNENLSITKGLNEVILDLSDVQKGIYLVTVGNGNNILTRKLIVE